MAAQLADELGSTAGYLSRILKALERRDCSRAPPRPPMHGASTCSSPLSAGGCSRPRAPFAAAGSLDAVGARRLAPGGAAGAMSVIRCAFSADGGQHRCRCAPTARGHGLGDRAPRRAVLPRVCWNEGFEALVAGITPNSSASSTRRASAAGSRKCGGPPPGMHFPGGRRDGTARLRLLLVEPEARGLGLGRTLVSECVRFARAGAMNGLSCDAGKPRGCPPSVRAGGIHATARNPITASDTISSPRPGSSS